MKNALVLFAHPNLKSYCGAFRDLTIKKMTEKNYKVLQSDLYQMKFNPVLHFGDINPQQKSQKDISITEELKKTFEMDNLEPDVRVELEKVFAANYLFFIAPMWYGSFPAILKGWLERVLIRGAAADLPDEIFSGGLLKGKKCIIVTTTGHPFEYYSHRGPKAGGQTLQENYWHIIEQGFAFCGMETLPIFASYGLDNMTEKQGKEYLAQYEKMLDNLENIQPIHCPLLHK